MVGHTSERHSRIASDDGEVLERLGIRMPIGAHQVVYRFRDNIGGRGAALVPVPLLIILIQPAVAIKVEDHAAHLVARRELLEHM